MTDAPLIGIAVTVLAIFGATLINNSRIGDVKEVLRAEVPADIGQLRSDLTSTMETRFSSIDRKLDEILRIVGDHETRITALEQRPR
jgi:low affinity Fe/Cu permease